MRGGAADTLVLAGLNPRGRCPAKIDIGPVFNVDPQKRSAYGGLGSDRVFAPVERELVFDVVRCFARCITTSQRPELTA